MADINKTYTSNTLYNDSTGVIAFAEQLKQELINWANYHHVTEELGPDNRPDTQNALNNLFLSVYERFLTFLNDADATEEAINTWKEIENFLADYTDEKTLAEIVAELNANIESRLTVPLESTTGSSTTSTMTQKAITETIDASSTFTTGEKVDNVGIDSEPTVGSHNLVDSDGIVKNLYNSIGDVFAITSFWGNIITNYNNGQIGKAIILDGVKIDGICVPVVGGNVYMFSDIQLWSHPNAANRVWFYSQYPTTENCLDCKIDVVGGVDGKFTAPSSAKYMVLSCEVDNCGNNKRIIVYVDEQSQHEVHIKDWILGECYTVSNAVRDSNGLVSSANIVYPDGMTGTLSITRNSDDAATSAVYTYDTDSYTLAITRDSNGEVTSTSIIKN